VIVLIENDEPAECERPRSPDAGNPAYLPDPNEPHDFNYMHEYAFDLVGNRFSKAVNGGPPTLYHYHGNHGLNDRLTGDSSGTVYDYDDNGFLIFKSASGITETYEANVEGRLAAYHNSDTDVSVTYRYDHQGIRTRASASLGAVTQHRRYLIDHHNHTGYAQILKELEGESNPTVVRSYTIGDDVLAQQAGSALHLLIQDGHGSTAAPWRALDGQVEQYFGYDAYGNGLDFPSQPLTEILYAGEQRDQDLGWYYLRARYYAPATGRFNRMDPYWGSPDDPLTLHKYVYCHNDPIDRFDPGGMFSFSLADMLSSIRVGLGKLAIRLQVLRRPADFGYRTLVSLAVLANLAYGTTDPTLYRVLPRATVENMKQLRNLWRVKPTDTWLRRLQRFAKVGINVTASTAR
jgi:RHS repeat-associated protein